MSINMTATAVVRLNTGTDDKMQLFVIHLLFLVNMSVSSLDCCAFQSDLKMCLNRERFIHACSKKQSG